MEYRNTITITTDLKNNYNMQMNVDIERIVSSSEDIHLVIDDTSYTIKTYMDFFWIIEVKIKKEHEKYVKAVFKLLNNMVRLYRINEIKKRLKKKVTFTKCNLRTCTKNEDFGSQTDFCIHFKLKKCKRNEFPVEDCVEAITTIFGCRPDYYSLSGSKFYFTIIYN